LIILGLISTQFQCTPIRLDVWSRIEDGLTGNGGPIDATRTDQAIQPTDKSKGLPIRSSRVLSSNGLGVVALPLAPQSTEAGRNLLRNPFDLRRSSQIEIAKSAKNPVFPLQSPFNRLARFVLHQASFIYSFLSLELL
jgi:hypothetical protein